MKTILAIDPGPVESAYLVWSDDGMVCAMLRRNESIAQLIRQGSFKECNVMAIEMIACYGMPVGKETFETCVWIGRFIEAAHPHWNLGERLIYRRDIKIHLCGSMKAKDSNIRQALIDKYGAPGTKKNKGKTYGISGHLWAALAVADYALNHE